MSKVIKKNASLAFILLLSIPVCASQHGTAESLKKVSQSHAIATAFGAILAKSGVKTAGQNAFAWASRTLPSWQTIRQAPRAGLALVQRGTAAVVHAGRHASSCLVPYVRPAINFTRSHPRMTQAAVGSLFATGLAYAIYKTVKYWKAHHPAVTLRTLPVAAGENPEAQVAGLGLDAQLPRRAARPHGAFRVPSDYQHQKPTAAAAAAQDTDTHEQTQQQIGKGEQHMQVADDLGLHSPEQAATAAAAQRASNPEQQHQPDLKGKKRMQDEMTVATAADHTTVTAHSLEDAGQHIAELKEEIALVTAAKEKIRMTHRLLKDIADAAEVYLNVLAKGNDQEISAAYENYVKVYTKAFDYSIGAVPERLTELANRYNGICAQILSICSNPTSFDNQQNISEITQLWNVVTTEIFPQFKKELEELEQTLEALEMSLQR